MKIVLAYSGGLDTSVILHWLKEKYQATVIAFIADVGQGEDMLAVARKASDTGADKVHLVDLKEEFVREYVFPAVKANAVYEGAYLMGTSLARPVIAKYLAQVARKEGAAAVAHGATGKGNDQIRFELTIAALEPELKVIAPWREWSFTSRADLFEYAEKRGIKLPITRDKPYSIDANLMHVSYEGGILEDPWNEAPADIFQMTVSPEEAPDEAEYVEIEFDKGAPTACNGEELSPAALLERLNSIAGRHGIGRVDIVENRFLGMKSRGIYETPGVTLLQPAHRAVESLAMDREAMHLRDSLIPKFAELVYNGFWHSPEMKALLAFFDATQEEIRGTARLKLYKGGVWVVGRKSPGSLYSPDAVSFDTIGSFNGTDAAGFIRLNALRLSLNRSLRWDG